MQPFELAALGSRTPENLRAWERHVHRWYIFTMPPVSQDDRLQMLEALADLEISAALLPSSCTVEYLSAEDIRVNQVVALNPDGTIREAKGQ